MAINLNDGRILIAKFSFTALAATAYLNNDMFDRTGTKAIGSTYAPAEAQGVDLGRFTWGRIVIQTSVTAVSGTTPTLVVSARCHNDNQLTAPATATTYAATAPDNSTAIACASMNSVSTTAITVAKYGNTGLGASNLGKFLTILATVGGTTPSYTGAVYVYADQ